MNIFNYIKYLVCVMWYLVKILKIGLKKILEIKILKMGLNVYIYEEFLFFFELKIDLRINFFWFYY